MAFTLADRAMIVKDPLEKGIIVGMMKAAPLMEMVPWDTTGTLQKAVRRYKTLPTGSFRALNEAFAESTGKLEQLSESMAIWGTYIDVDTELEDATDNIQSPRALQTAMHTKALAYQFNDWFLNGDKAVDPKSFDGIKVRIASLPTSQTIAAGLSIKVADLSTNAQAVMDKIDELIYACDEHKCDALLMNDTTFLRISGMMRRADVLDRTKDQFGRIVNTYNGAKLIDLGVKADQTTKVLADDHDGVAGVVSMYAVKFGAGEYLQGLQKHDLKTDDIGKLQTKSVYRTEISWPITLACWNVRSMARLSGLTIA